MTANPYDDPAPSHDSYGVPLDCIYCGKPIAEGESSDDNDELCMDCEPEYAATLGGAL